MALVSSVKRLLHVHPAITFFAGMLAGLLISQLSADSMRPFPITAPPQLLSSLPRQGVSHAPDVKKRVLAAKGDIPHVTQVRRPPILPPIRCIFHLSMD